MRVALRWEKLRVPVHVAVDVNGKVLRDGARRGGFGKGGRLAHALPRGELGATTTALLPPMSPRGPRRRCKLKENFNTLSLAAKLAQKSGNSKAAIAQLTKAIALGKADKDVEAVQIAPLEKLLAEWSAKK